MLLLAFLKFKPELKISIFQISKLLGIRVSIFNLCGVMASVAGPSVASAMKKKSDGFVVLI
jgi:hypothetical protein